MISSGASPEMMTEESDSANRGRQAFDSDDLDGTVTWRELLAETEVRLAREGRSETAQVEAKWIIEEVTGASGSELAEALSGLATVRGVAKLDSLVERRVNGEPIQYVLGHWPFRSIDLLIDQRVLIPRPETEVVAGLAIAELDRLEVNASATVVDLGTGSGAIGLSVASERPATRVLITDVSSDALAVARANLAGLGNAARGVEVAAGSWFDAIPERYKGHCHVIISNPPYIPTTERLDASVLDWEPESALRSGAEGLDDLFHIVDHAGDWLAPTGALVLEMAADQTSRVAKRGVDRGYTCSIHADLAGLDRAVVMRRG